MPYDVLLLSPHLSTLAQDVAGFFQADVARGQDELPTLMSGKRYRIVVMDMIGDSPIDLSSCEKLLRQEFMQNMPLVVLTTDYSVKDKVKALEVGCDDLIDSKTTPDEVFARITKSIFHQIANSQLNQRLQLATETARNVMVDNSDLGANIQFLLQIQNCDNLDQLGQQFFATIQRYGLSCSLQMRSEMGKKDMEAHGMAKHLESQLLFQLKDSGRYVDFGPRTIVNYDRVSLLIKNMPLNDAEKYGSIKDNTFCLVQGINARILALEDRFKLLREKEALHKLGNDVRTVMGGLKMAYQDVMKQIVGEVENVTEKLEHRLPHLALTEADEQLIYDLSAKLVVETNRIFNEGLKVDEYFERLEGTIKRSLAAASDPSEVREVKPPDSNVVELF
ncbi:MAG: DNA-binding response regulator [Cellvibrionaceae bacterium]|nr:DNA-binding response regulator [Cellvibrionaceae bacterium]